MKTILLIGATSNIGRVLKERLSTNYHILTAGRTDCDVYLDLSDPSSVDLSALSFDIILHCAAHFGGETPADLYMAQTVNTLATTRLFLEAKKKGNFKFIFISSLFAGFEPSSPWYTPYAISKAQAEHWLKYLAKDSNMELLILRPTMIYGDDLRFSSHQSMPYYFLDRAHNNEGIYLFGDGRALRNYLHAEDLADIISSCLQKDVCGIHSCMHPTSLSILEMAQCIASLTGTPQEIQLQLEVKSPPSLDLVPDLMLYDQIGKHDFIDFASGMRRIYSKNYH
jgi:nucleoside-diphosphate-sugar epimerase